MNVSCILAANLLVPLFHRPAIALRSAGLWSWRFKSAVGSLVLPSCQHRAVQVFPAEENSQYTPELESHFTLALRPLSAADQN
jgi:hypothetical protein